MYTRPGSISEVPIGPLTDWRHANRLACAVVLTVGMLSGATAQTPQSFRFETFESLEDMQQFIEKRFSVGTPQDAVRKAFVAQGKATLRHHPTQAGVEKYIYDINLCGYYVWRWNISADFDTRGRLLQAYLNGNPVLKDGTPKRDFKALMKQGGKQSIYKMQRPRPEAAKGEKSLSFIMADLDSDPKTIDDQALVGAGPSRADPLNMGRLVTYIEVEPWRSIFDPDNADRIVPFAGDCSKADAVHQNTRPGKQ